MTKPPPSESDSPRYALTESAEQDVEEILDRISERDGIARAQRVLGRFEKAFNTLSAHPGLGTVRTGLTGPHIRWWPVANWLVLYQRGGSFVRVLRVINGARDLECLRDPLDDETPDS